MKFKFPISPQAKRRAFTFAEDIASKQAQSKRDFGSEKVRGRADFIADTVEGKLAEEGFASFLLQNYGIQSKVDYDIYADKTETDYGNDLQEIMTGGKNRIALFKVDIKSTRPYAQWMLVERHKFIANVFVMVSISGMKDDWEKDPYASKNCKLWATVVGFAYYTDFIDIESRKPWFLFKQGDPLIREKDVRAVITHLQERIKVTPFTVKRRLQVHISKGKIKPMNVKLKSPINYAIPKAWLRNEKDDWDIFIEMIRLSARRPSDSIIQREMRTWQRSSL